MHTKIFSVSLQISQVYNLILGGTIRQLFLKSIHILCTYSEYISGSILNDKQREHSGQIVCVYLYEILV